MSRRKVLKNTITRSLVAAMTLFVASAAFAATAPRFPIEQWNGDKPLGDGIRDLEPRPLTARPERGTAALSGLTFDLPANTVKPSAQLKVSVLNGVRVYVEETIVLPPALNAAPTIAFLANHPQELARVRMAATARPDAIRFTVSANGKLIVNVPFIEVDGGSERVADGGSVVGSSRSVTVRLRDPRKTATNAIDPACEAECDQQFYDCYTYCDERGPGCPWCQEQYSDCINSCPQICVEPKDVLTVYSGWGYAGSINHGTICINYSAAYLLWEDVYARNVYQRTVHCDDSYTDVYQGTQYSSTYCKEFIGPGCSGDFYNPPPTC
jgi:hypothetical protein